LPEPEGPSKVKNSPPPISRSTLATATATAGPYVLRTATRRTAPVRPRDDLARLTAMAAWLKTSSSSEEITVQDVAARSADGLYRCRTGPRWAVVPVAVKDVPIISPLAEVESRGLVVMNVPLAPEE
jgi:hypothetical protein